MSESGRALDWLLREGTRAIVVLGSINLPAGPAQVASEIAPLPPIEPIARPAVHPFFGPNRSFVGSEPVEFPSRDFAASDSRADAGGLSVLSGIHASWACSAIVVAKGESRRREDDSNRSCREISTEHTRLLKRSKPEQRLMTCSLG
jgi:hypothetical protein